MVWTGTQSWSAVVLSWLEPQHIWIELRPVKRKAAQKSPRPRGSKRFLVPPKHSHQIFDLGPNLFPSTVWVHV